MTESELCHIEDPQRPPTPKWGLLRLVLLKTKPEKQNTF